MKEEVKDELMEDAMPEVKLEVKDEEKQEVKEEVKLEVKDELKEEVQQEEGCDVGAATFSRRIRLRKKMKLEDGSAGPVVSFTFQTKDEAQLVHDFVKDLINQMRADKKAAKEKAQGE